MNIRQISADKAQQLVGDELLDLGDAVWIATDDNKAVMGFAPPIDSMLTLFLWGHPSVRKSAAARRYLPLLGFACDVALGSGADKLLAFVEPENTSAKHMYERLGFVYVEIKDLPDYDVMVMEVGDNG